MSKEIEQERAVQLGQHIHELIKRSGLNVSGIEYYESDNGVDVILQESVTEIKSDTDSYTASSSHTIGYGLSITAPKAITEAEIGELIEGLINWDDKPDTSQLRDYLEDQKHEEYGDMEHCKLESHSLYMEITVDPDVCHRDPHICDNLKKVG